MARRENELFIGKEYINKEGRTIKHLALIKEFAQSNINKIKEEPLKLVGLDLETEASTGELKLLGFYDGEKYCYYENNFLNVLFSWIKSLEKKNMHIAYWNRLDPAVLYKQFLLLFDKETAYKSMARFGKIAGKWDRKKGEWIIQPVIEVKRGNFYYGIENAVRSSIKFYYRKKGSNFINTVWAYDIAQLYEMGLEKEALYNIGTKENPIQRLPYYTKLDKSAHLVDWKRYFNDSDYKHNIVLKSNELDARAVYDLGNIIQEEFKKAFNWYSNTIVSSGSLARSAIVAVIYNKYKDLYPDKDKKVSRLTLKDINSICLDNFKDRWVKEYGGEFYKDFHCLLTESYSGGYIESLKYGYAKEGYYADIASAYPAVIKELYNLEGAKITKGSGEPPHTPYSYCFIRGVVDIPTWIDYNPITIKDTVNKDTNIRAVGKYRASYTLEERDFLIQYGAKFTDEIYYNVETKGVLSPLAEVENHLLALREMFKKEGNSAQYIAKKTANSGYGILFEAVDTYEEDIDGVVRAGYRAGEFFNPLYASIITSRTRILIAKSCMAIHKAGGEPILVMTDSIFWKGNKNMLPPELWKKPKTVGYFEEPEKVTDIVCLGSGRYCYTDPVKGYTTSKRRGLNITDIHDKDGILIDNFNWLNALKIAQKQNSTIIKVKVRVLISVGIVLHNSNYDIKDLGLVTEQDREVDLIVGKSKRFFDESVKNPTVLLNGLVNTQSKFMGYGMLGTNDYNDQTLPSLRKLLENKKVVTQEVKNRKSQNKASRNWNSKNKDKTKKAINHKYKQIRAYGYSSEEANKMAKWSIEHIMEFIKEDKRDDKS